MLYLRPLHNPIIVIASEAKQSHNTLISHPPECFGGPRRFAPRNDQDWAKVGVMQSSLSVRICLLKNKISPNQSFFQ